MHAGVKSWIATAYGLAMTGFQAMPALHCRHRNDGMVPMPHYAGACTADIAITAFYSPNRRTKNAYSSDDSANFLSRPSSWILRVMVLRPMPNLVAASMRRPRVLVSAA